VQRINPLFADLNPVDRDIAALIFEGLTRTNSFGEPEPALAANWVISGDGLEYVVQLRDDIRWQDGTPFTAADVDYTMSLLRSPDYPGPESIGSFWRTVETEILGEHLVRFRLTQPLGSFLDKLTIGILPAHVLAGTDAQSLAQHPFNLSPIGTGPYQLEAMRTDPAGNITLVDLRAAPVYRERPEGQVGFGIDRIRFALFDRFEAAQSALRAGDIDGLATPDHSYRATLLAQLDETQFQTFNAIEPTLGVLIFNWQNDDVAFFRDQRVRLSLETGVDRASVVERTLRTRAIDADSPLFPGSWAYVSDLPWPAYDPEVARYLLDTARVTRSETTEDEVPADESATRIDFSIIAPNDPALVGMLSEISAQWSQLNINVTIEPLDSETYQSRLNAGEFDAALIETNLGASADPDLYSFWHQGQYPDGLNYGGVDDRRISETLERARREPNGLNRRIHYTEFQREFVDRAIALPLYYPIFTYVTDNDLQGVQLGFIGSPTDRFRNIQDWSLR
jgi:peptide/nickel transport system substrate-binding protein